MIQCVVFAVGPLPITSFTRPPDITHMVDETRPSLFFCALTLPCIILNANRRTKNGGGLGTRLGGASYGLVKLDETNDVIVVN